MAWDEGAVVLSAEVEHLEPSPKVWRRNLELIRCNEVLYSHKLVIHLVNAARREYERVETRLTFDPPAPNRLLLSCVSSCLLHYPTILPL